MRIGPWLAGRCPELSMKMLRHRGIWRQGNDDSGWDLLTMSSGISARVQYVRGKRQGRLSVWCSGRGGFWWWVLAACRVVAGRVGHGLVFGGPVRGGVVSRVGAGVVTPARFAADRRRGGMPVGRKGRGGCRVATVTRSWRARLGRWRAGRSAAGLHYRPGLLGLFSLLGRPGLLDRSGLRFPAGVRVAAGCRPVHRTRRWRRTHR